MNDNNFLLSIDIKYKIGFEALTGIRSIEELALLHSVPVGDIIEWKNDSMRLCRKDFQNSVESIVGSYSKNFSPP
jgi:uncharacterized protein YkvS